MREFFLILLFPFFPSFHQALICSLFYVFYLGGHTSWCSGLNPEMFFSDSFFHFKKKII